MLEFLENDIGKESFDKILELLIKNQIVKTSCYANKACLSIPKEDQINNIHMTEKDDLKEDFSNFKNLMIYEFESMKHFFKEVNFFKINFKKYLKLILLEYNHKLIKSVFKAF